MGWAGLGLLAGWHELITRIDEQRSFSHTVALPACRTTLALTPLPAPVFLLARVGNDVCVNLEPKVLDLVADSSSFTLGGSGGGSGGLVRWEGGWEGG